MSDIEMMTKSRKYAYSLARRRPHGDDRYGIDDLVQDGCLAELQGRSAWWGMMDGLRRWLGRHGSIQTVPLNEAYHVAVPPTVIDRLIACEELDRHFAWLDGLKPRYRCAYMLCRHEGKSESQAAKILSCHQTRVSQILKYLE